MAPNHDISDQELNFYHRLGLPYLSATPNSLSSLVATWIEWLLPV